MDPDCRIRTICLRIDEAVVYQVDDGRLKYLYRSKGRSTKIKELVHRALDLIKAYRHILHPVWRDTLLTQAISGLKAAVDGRAAAAKNLLDSAEFTRQAHALDMKVGNRGPRESAVGTERGERDWGDHAADQTNRSHAEPGAAKVFVSYAHSSPEHRQSVSSLVEALRAKGMAVVVDTDVKTPQGPEVGWPRWMKQQINEADWVLMVFDETYRHRFDGDEEPDRGLGATWEGAIITHRFHRGSTRNTKFIPLLADGATPDLVPDEFHGYTHYFVPTQTSELAAALVQAR
jgi:hypothetical protein